MSKFLKYLSEAKIEFNDYHKWEKAIADKTNDDYSLETEGDFEVAYQTKYSAKKDDFFRGKKVGSWNNKSETGWVK